MKKQIFIMILLPALLFAGNKADSLLKLLDKASPASKPSILNNLSEISLKNSSIQSLNYAKQALSISENLSDTAGILTSLSNIVWAYHKSGDVPEALENYLDIAKIQAKTGDKQGLSTTYNNMGWILYHESNYSQALKYYQLALKLKREVDDKAGEAKTLHNISGCYVKTGDKAKAMEYLIMSYEIKAIIKDTAAAKSTLNDMNKLYSSTENEINIRKQLERILKASDSAHLEEMSRLSSDLSARDKLLADKEADIEIFKTQIIKSAREIEDRENRIRNQRITIDTLVERKLRDSLKILNLLNQDLIKNQRLSNLILAVQKNSIDSKQDSITRLNQKIQIDSLTLIRNKEHVELLRKENTHQAELAENREKLLDNQRILYGSVIALLSTIAVFFIYRFSTRKKYYETLAEKNRELETEKEKAELASSYKTEFLANMSHEIRTPMNAILGFSDLLSKRIDDPKNKDYVSSIVTSGKSLLTLINDILDLSKIEAGKFELDFEPVDIRNLFEEVRQIFDLNIKGKGLGFQMDVDEKLPAALMLDETRLRQILVNLVGNAIKFTHKGEITLSAKALEISDTDATLALSVEDTGIGIPKSQQEIIFESFRQQSGQKSKFYGGTGLGLSITRRLAEMMHGTIIVESEVDRGSKFTVVFETISIADNAEMQLSAIPQLLSGNARFKPSNILLVDDVETNRRLVREYLHGTKITIYEADTGGVALETAFKIAPDLVLLDIRLPDMTGFEVVEAIRASEALKKLPVIALTASAMKSDFDKIRETGFSGYLTKPINKNMLLLEIMKYIEYEIPTDSRETVPGIPYSGLNHAGGTETYDTGQLQYALNIINNEIMPEYETVVNTQRIGTIKMFTGRLSELAARLNIAILSNYAETLGRHTDSFDLGNIRAALARFPDVISELKSKL